MTAALNKLEWPAYGTGPKDSVFAIGVVSVNFARLEFALYGLFANACGLSGSHASMQMAKLKTDQRVRRIKNAINQNTWPKEAKEHIGHFLTAYVSIARNRNLLMHSNLISGVQNQTALYKTNRDGRTELSQVSLGELRQVADDINEYFDYGLSVVNKIALDVGSIKKIARASVFFDWPEKPELPRELEYRDS